jgi:hypothetical protein
MPLPESGEQVLKQLLIPGGQCLLVKQDQPDGSGRGRIAGQGLQQVARTHGVVPRFAQFRPEQRAGPVRRYYDEDTGRRHLRMMAQPLRPGNDRAATHAGRRMVTIRPRFSFLAISLSLGLVATLAACSDHGERHVAAGAGAAQSPAAGAACPDQQFISSAVGFAVRSMPRAASAGNGVLLCAYRSADAGLGAFVSIAAAPLAPGEDALAEVRAAAGASGGPGAEPIDVGERGYAYGSSSKSEAAAIRASRVYHVDVSATTAIGNRKDAAIAILRRVMG